jgi:hypothetical protein
MRWTPVACVLWLAGGTGCPHAFGRGGTVDRAVAKDMEERLEDYPDCTPEVYQELCLSEPHDAQACLEKCGG